MMADNPQENRFSNERFVELDLSGNDLQLAIIEWIICTRELLFYRVSWGHSMRAQATKL